MAKFRLRLMHMERKLSSRGPLIDGTIDRVLWKAQIVCIYEIIFIFDEIQWVAVEGRGSATTT